MDNKQDRCIASRLFYRAGGNTLFGLLLLVLMAFLVLSDHVPDFVLYSLALIFAMYAFIYFILVKLLDVAAKHLSRPVERLPVYSRETGELLDEAGHKEMDERFRQSTHNQQFWLLRWIDQYLLPLLILGVILVAIAKWMAVL